MTEEERAEWLARAIDDLIANRPQTDSLQDRPPDLDVDEIDSLLRVARARLYAGNAVARAGLRYEGEVWQRLLERLGAESGRTVPDAPPETIAEDLELDEGALKELEETARLRQRMSRQLIAFAQTQRESVWRQVEARLATRRRTGRRRFFSFFSGSAQRRRADELAAAIDGSVVGQRLWQAADSRLEELIALAKKRHAVGRAARSEAAASAERVWARLAPIIPSTPLRAGAAGYGEVSPEGAGRPFALPFDFARGRRFALGAAAAGITALALGPLPATGLSGHPGVEAMEFVGRHIAVMESEPPPGTVPEPTVLHGTPMTAAQASRAMGLPIMSLVPPAAFKSVSSLHFSEGIGARDGVFLQAFTSEGETVLVFQEAAEGMDMGVAPGSVRGVTLADGTVASVVRGAWVQGSEGFTWQSGGAQTLVFERDGVRTIIEQPGASDAATVLAFARALTQQD